MWKVEREKERDSWKFHRQSFETIIGKWPKSFGFRLLQIDSLT
jgi:hypothetical protein